MIFQITVLVLSILEIPNRQPQAMHIRSPSSTGTLELCMFRRAAKKQLLDKFYFTQHALARK